MSTFDFDAFGNVEDLNLILCNPGCYIDQGRIHGAISSIPYVTDLEFTKKFNDISEINFRVHYAEDDNDDRNRVVGEIFNMIEEDRYVYVGNHTDGSGGIYDVFFKIVGCDYSCENGERCKDVKAMSRGCELMARNVPYIPSGLYKLCHIAPFKSNDFVLGIRNGYSAPITESDSVITLSDEYDENGLMHFDCAATITPQFGYKMYVCREGDEPVQSLDDIPWTSEAVTIDADTNITISLSRNDGDPIGHLDISTLDIVTSSSDIKRVTDSFIVEHLNTIMGILFEGSDWGYMIGDGYGDSVFQIQDVLDTRVRSFDGVDTTKSIYDFLMDDVQKAFECVFRMSEGYTHGESYRDGEYTYDKPYHNGAVHIELYDTLSTPTDDYIFISSDTFILSGRRSLESSNVYTAMRGYGGILKSQSVSVGSDGSVSGLGDGISSGGSSDDKFTIAAVNPIGGSVVYNFSRYYDWMTPSLKAAVISWDETVREKEEIYIGYSRDYYAAAYSSSEYQREIDMYNVQKDIYTRCLTNLGSIDSLAVVTTYNEELSKIGVEQLPINAQTTVASMENTINGRIAEIDSNIAAAELNKSIQDVVALSKKSLMDEINEECSFEHNFTKAQFGELVSYIKEAEYNDDFVAYSTDMDVDEQIDAVIETYRRTRNALDVASQPIYQYEIDIDGYMFVPEFNDMAIACTDVGKLIHVDIDGTGYQTLFITEAVYNFDDKTCRLALASTLVKSDVRSLFRSVFDSISDSYTTQYKLTAR